MKIRNWKQPFACFQFLSQIEFWKQFLFSANFELPNKFFSLKNRKLFLKTKNKEKKQLPNIPLYSFSANDRVHRRWRNGARVSRNWQVSYSHGSYDKRESRVTAMHCCSFLHCVVRYFYLHRELIFHRLLHDVVCVNWESPESRQTLHSNP